MEHLIRRSAAVAASALTFGGLIAVLTPTNPDLPDIQVRGVDLAAANVEAHPVLDIVENHVRPDVIGDAGYQGQYVDIGELLFGRGGENAGAGSGLDVDALSQDELTELTGGNFDPQNLPLGLQFDPDPGAFVTPTTGAVGGGEQAAGSAAASAAAGIVWMMQAIPDLQQALNNAIVAAETEFNSALVAAQQAAADRIFGDDPAVNDAVTWIFSLNNTVLANNEAAFNSLFGIAYDPHTTLLGGFAPEIAAVDWETLLGFSPDQFDQIIEALQADNLALLMGNLDWAGLFAGLF